MDQVSLPCLALSPERAGYQAIYHEHIVMKYSFSDYYLPSKETFCKKYRDYLVAF